MLRWILRIVCAIAVLAVGWGAFIYAESGQLRELEPLSSGPCVAVTGAPGAEDIEIDRERGLAILSSDDRRRAMAGERDTGGLFVYDLRGSGTTAEPIGHDFEGELRPHGIYLLEGGSESLLFVVNHGGGKHTIEVFDWDGETLGHRATHEHELLVSPNDVAAIDEQRFYVTNDHSTDGAMGQLFEDYLRLARGSVVYFEADQAREVAGGIAYANGVAINPQATVVYVASTTEGELRRYARDEETGDLELIEAESLGTGLDNIEVDRHGNLWIAAHPHLMSFVRHARNESVNSPSEVLWVDPLRNLDPPVRPVWLDLGNELSGASVALPFGGRFVVGSVFEDHFLVCSRES